MSKPFDAYAAYYDLLYAEKDYAGEAAYVDRIIRRYRPDAHTLLELGAGTGGHAIHFAQRGYAVHGIDLSPAMVSLAEARKAPEGTEPPTFETADLRGFRAGRHFDAVVSLFHVMSYQVTDDDLRAAMATAAAHLAPGGVFVFDCWYGPGVLADPPATRTRTLSGNGVSIVRNAHPVHDPGRHRVDVRFEIDVHGNGTHERIEEVHAMRYLFDGEIDDVLSEAGLQPLVSSAWLEEASPDESNWHACFVARKTAG